MFGAQESHIAECHLVTARVAFGRLYFREWWTRLSIPHHVDLNVHDDLDDPDHDEIAIYPHRLQQAVIAYLRRGHRVQPDRMEHRRAKRCVCDPIMLIIPTYQHALLTLPRVGLCDYTEYRNKTITRIFGGNARYGCYFLALCIFSAGMVRDAL